MDAPTYPQDHPEPKATGDYNRLSSQISKSQTDEDPDADHIYAMSDRFQLSNHAIASLGEQNISNRDKNTLISKVGASPPLKNNARGSSRALPPLNLQNNASSSTVTPLQIPLYYNHLTESSTDEPITQESKERKNQRSEERELPGIPNSSVRARSIQQSSGNPRNQGSSRNILIGSSNKTSSEVESQKVQTFRERYRNCFTFLFIFVLLSLVIVGSTLGGVILVGYRIQDRIQDTFDESSDNMAAMLEDSHINLTKRVSALCSTNQVVADIRILFGDSCYCLYRKKLSWFDAREFCLSLGNEVHLAEIYNTRTNDLLLPILQHSSVNDGIWLGGCDLAEKNKWVWNYTGRAMEIFSPTSQWEPGQPSGLSHLNVPEYCLYLFRWNVPNYMWNDHVCDDIKPFVCMSAHENSKCYC